MSNPSDFEPRSAAELSFLNHASASYPDLASRVEAVQALRARGTPINTAFLTAEDHAAWDAYLRAKLPLVKPTPVPPSGLPSPTPGSGSQFTPSSWPG